MTLLVIAEHDNATLQPATRHAVSAARRIGGNIHLLVAGSDCAPVAEAAARIAGVDKVWLVDAAHYADPSPENMAALIVAHAAGYGHILAAAGSAGKSFMPRVAARLDVAQISEIVDVITPDTFVRPIYAGNVLATVRSADAVKVVTVRATAFHDADESASSAAVERLPAAADQGQTRVIKREMTASVRPPLADARVVVAGGRGLGSRENFDALLAPLADKLGGALGATRAAVDAGYAPNDWQVGQTGQVVAPALYLAVGLSGAIQHLAGMRGSRVIVAINKDPEAPIFQIADVGLVADLFDALPALAAALE